MRHAQVVRMLLLASLLLVQHGYAASLGNLALSSSLGEPLLAELTVQLEAQESIADLQATLASEAAYAKQEIRYQVLYNDVKVELQANQQGLPVIKLSSSLPINEPYLDVLVQLDWSAGRLQKHYIVLLDPPQSDQPEQDPIAAPLASNANPPEPGSELQTTMLPDQAALPMPLAMISQSGDTLYALAKAMQVEGVSLDQMLLGLYQANPTAFAAGNMNQLKVGQRLSLPSQASLLAIQADKAAAEVKLHTANWQAYRAALANRVLNQNAVAELAPGQSAAGKIASAEDKATAVKTASNAVLKLSAGEKEGPNTADAKVLALQEDATAREKSLQESEARAKALQQQIKDMQHLLQLKNQSVADLQKRATEAKQALSAKPNQKRAAWADWLVLSITLLAIVAAFTWLISSNRRRANLLDFNDVNKAMPAVRAEVEPEVVSVLSSAVEPDSPPVDLTGLDLNFTEPAVVPVKPTELPVKPVKAKAKKKPAVTSFIKTDANELDPSDGDMEVIRIDLSSISLDLTGTEDELTLAKSVVDSTKTPNATET